MGSAFCKKKKKKSPETLGATESGRERRVVFSERACTTLILENLERT